MDVKKNTINKIEFKEDSLIPKPDSCNLIKTITKFSKEYPITHQESMPKSFYETIFFTDKKDTMLLIMRTRLMGNQNHSNTMLFMDYSFLNIFGLVYNPNEREKKIPYQGSYRINENSWSHFYFYNDFDLYKKFTSLNDLKKINLHDYAMSHYGDYTTPPFTPNHCLYLIKNDSIIEMTKLKEQKNQHHIY